MRLRSSKKALEDSQRFAALFPGLSAVLADLAQVESIEQQADAAEQRLAAATKATADKQAEIETLAKTHEANKAMADGEIAAKKQQGETVAAAARETAAQIVAEAQGKADAIIDAAESQVDATQDAAQEKLDALTAQILQQQNALQAVMGRVAAVNEKLLAAQQSLVEIEAQKAALKAKLG